MQTTQATQVGWGWRKWLGLAALPLAVLSGCESAGGTGTLAGGAGGAVLGNVIAKAAGGSRTLGTVLGGAAGAIAGGVIGDNVDRKNAQQAAVNQAAASVAAQQSGLQQVAQLAQTGNSDPVIINKVRTDGIVYTLSADQINYLKQNNVSDAVITEMQATAYRAQFAPPPQRVYPYPPPPAYSVGVGGR